MILGKKIIIGITGSIAAYKSTYLVRELIKKGAEVKVVLTPSSVEFVTPLTLATLSKNKVYSDFTEDKNTGEWTNHVELGLWGDLMLIAPITANTLSKLASGACDNFLLATFLSAKCPVMLAPAMDLDMYSNSATQDNLDVLKKRGITVLDSPSGELASGLSGKGRMEEPEEIANAIEDFFTSNKPLAGRKALVTAGPTYENIDPVRFIGNYSSGKMGFAIAEALSNQGAQVTLVSGPSALQTTNPEIKLIKVTSALEMMEACKNAFPSVNITVMAAAVSDYRPSIRADSKIKREKEGAFSIDLVPNPDIIKTLGSAKTDSQYLLGFALETNNAEENAKKKIISKNLDAIVLNSLEDKGAGFGVDTNKISIIDSDNKITRFELKSKADVASDIVDFIITRTSK
ncbi:MAG TPA: bifunctional phosphopantothenoylcysteine decarboxylase/phosphopantothenate--cysteine ligase CoaBC [Flavobacteriales bacterium]|nr:bifunctional phosphopantothenoylcysteine decarboxylase/phosphopantothenate--cysteine ligase CoaBC [Flavobacteriales bacterium]|tara:strand:+ start:9557 stop:10765 length:1209 start_codon:yes stop_codon:yes gene_type:complete